MAKTSTTTQGLRAAIERSGYYPAEQLVPLLEVRS